MASELTVVHAWDAISVPHGQDVSRLVNAVPDVEIREIHTAMRGVFKRMKTNLIKEGVYPDNLPKRSSTTTSTA